MRRSRLLVLVLILVTTGCSAVDGLGGAASRNVVDPREKRESSESPTVVAYASQLT